MHTATSQPALKSAAPPTRTAKAPETTAPRAGNQAMLRSPGANPRSGGHVLQRKCDCGSPDRVDKKSLLQPKLEVGAVNDPSEQEADRVADEVMRPNGAAPALSAPSIVQRKISRQADAPEVAYDSALPPDMEKKQDQPAAAAAPVQRSATGDAAGGAPQGFEGALNRRIGAGGEAMPAPVGAFMSERFGRSFEGVRIHRDPEAGALAKDVQARAFTIGGDIFFANGAYQPNSQEGQRLIAHELTHVVQQGASPSAVSRKIQRQGARGTCAAYPGYESGVALNTYNCAGLALRNYQFIAPSSAVDTALVNLHPNGKSMPCDAPCGAGKIKYWKWDYTLETADSAGNVVPGTGHPDFHIVAGITDSAGNDPTNVYTKNGKRPVHGTGTGPSFKPPAFAPYLSNDAKEQPTGSYVKRSGIIDSCFCSEC